MRVFLAVFFLLAGPVQAQDAGGFARMPLGARAVALGGGLSADLFGTASPYHNPALAPYTATQTLEVGAAFQPFDREWQVLQFAAPLQPRAGIAGGIVHAGVSEIDGRDGSGYHTGTYSTDEYAFFLAFGTRLSERVTAGVGLRLYRAQLFEGVDAALSLALGLGLTARLTDRLALGFVADDLLARYTWDTSEAFGTSGANTTDRFPVRLRLGAAYALPAERGLLTAEVEAQVRRADARTTERLVSNGLSVPVTTTEALQEVRTRLRLGGEVWLARPFALRLGIDQLGSADVLAGSRPSAGFALRERLGELDGRLDYAAALEPYGLGVQHLVGLTLNL